MEKFKVGDMIMCIEREEDSVAIGKKYKVIGLDSDGDPEIGNDYDEAECYHSSFFRLVERNGKPFKEDLVRYMVYGTGCDNKSDLYRTEKDMAKEVRECADDGEWTGEIIGYKLTPIFKVERKTILKKFKKETPKTKKKAKK